jgi:AcrR family transcriptional regulator
MTTASSATARAPWGTISREQVVETATRIVSDGGSEQMTIRGLAAELGVAPMSLYRHVRDKDDLLNEVVDRLFTDAWQPLSNELSARAWLGEAADNLRRFLVEQPAALHVYLSHPVVSTAALARMQAMLRVLRQVTGDQDQAQRAYAAIHTYTVGFAALEASRAGWQPGGSSVGAESETDPGTESLADQLASYTTPHQFAEGLDYLLDGITSTASQASAAAHGGRPGRP